jgi:hypothetical protein
MKIIFSIYFWFCYASCCLIWLIYRGKRSKEEIIEKCLFTVLIMFFVIPLPLIFSIGARMSFPGAKYFVQLQYAIESEMHGDDKLYVVFDENTREYYLSRGKIILKQKNKE